jgi:SET domain-containing protein
MGLIVRSSHLHGAGVYTLAPIAKGTHVLEYTGPRISHKQCEGLYSNSEVTYLFTMDDEQTFIDGFGMAAFVNHSCDPNCETDQFGDQIWIIAIRDIAAGEELLYDYHLWDAEPEDLAPCYCGAKTCRGTMYSTEEIERQKKLLHRRALRKKARKLAEKKSGKRKKRPTR